MVKNLLIAEYTFLLSVNDNTICIHNKFCVSVINYRWPNGWTDRDRIWHVHADRPGDGSNLKIFMPCMARKGMLIGATLLRGRSQFSTFMKAYTAYARGGGLGPPYAFFPKNQNLILITDNVL